MKGPELFAPLRVRNSTKGTDVAESVRVADTFASRLKGLLGDGALPPGEGLLIYPCTAIHTFGMRFALDAVFVDREARVLKVYRRMAPWRLSTVVKGAWGVLELPAGAAERAGIGAGDTLAFEPPV